MATCFAPTTMQRVSSSTSTSSRSMSLDSAFRAPLPLALRRSAGTINSSRAAAVVPRAFRGQGPNPWGGRNFQRRGAFGPLEWQFNGPMGQPSLEDLAREFGFSMKQDCGPAGSQKGRDVWSEIVGQASFPVDFEEQDGDYLLTADVPGLQKSDLKITVNKDERSLTVSGERRRASANASEQSQKRRQRLERRMGKFQRTFSSLPDDVDLTSVSARVEKGVLAITIRKLPEVQQPDNTINVTID